MILESNAFIERVLPGSIKRKLSDEEMAAYRNPFLTPEFPAADMAAPKRAADRGRAGRCPCRP